MELRRAVDGRWGATWNRPADLNTNSAYNVTTLTGKQYSGTNAWHDYAEVTGAKVVPTKNTANGKSTFTAGDTITYKIDVATNIGPSSPPIDVLTIDTLPDGLEYVDGSANVAPDSVVYNGDGTTTITWTLQDVSDDAVTSITYDAVAKISGGSATLTNTVQLTGRAAGTTNQLDGNVPVSQRSSTKSVNIANGGYTRIRKSVDKAQINKNESFAYTLTLENHDPVDQTYTDMIDILPYTGDGRTPATAYHGSHNIEDVVVSAGQTVYYSTADPDLIDLDPAGSSNGSAGSIVGNTVGWATTKPAGGITAIRIIGGAWAAFAADRTAVITVSTDGNAGSDVYTNRVGARSEHTFLRMFSPDVTTTVIPDPVPPTTPAPGAPNTGVGGYLSIGALIAAGSILAIGIIGRIYSRKARL